MGNIRTSGNPLLLIKVIEKHILPQTEDTYPFVSVYKQEQTLYTFHHNKLTNEHLYEKFTTNYDAANAIGVTIQHKVLLEHVS